MRKTEEFTYHMLIQWLAYNDALNNWMESVINTEDDFSHLFYNINVSEVISGIFIWENSSYWRKLDDEWREYLKTLYEHADKVYMI